MSQERYIAVRERLIELFPLITEYTYDVVASPSIFLSLKRLKEISEADDRLIGTEIIGNVVERQINIPKMAQAISLNGEYTEMAFRYPSRAIPQIYEGIQEYIKLWIEVKTDYGWLPTPSLEELGELEAVAKFIFTAYKEYYFAKIAKQSGYKADATGTMQSALMSIWMFGKDALQEDISFISYIALYKESQGLGGHQRSEHGRSESLDELLNGSYGFGSGIQGLV